MRKAFVAVAVSVFMLGWGINRAMAVCGDGVVDADEDCDQGGTCIGGPTAGTACHVGDSTCTGGTCTTFGGNGCAANCTTEHDVPFELVPGEVPPGASQPAPGTSGVAIASSILNIPLPLSSPSQQTLTVGKLKDGKIPVVVKASSVMYPAVPVQTVACGCIHGVAAKTCGGTLYEPDGKTLSTDCTPGYTTGDPCAGKAPCAFVNGEGNTAAGEIGCDGLDGTDILFEQDAATGGPAVVTVSGHGGPGSANIAQTLGISALLGTCTGSGADYGPDGQFCTDDDPGTGLVLTIAQTLPSGTGMATAVVHNTGGTSDDLGPVMATGGVFSCAALECGAQSSAAGAGLAGAFTLVGLETVGDIAATAQQFASGTLPDPSQCGVSTGCAGDCGGDGTVTVDEIIILVNIILGSADASACPDGIVPPGSTVDVTLAIRAVNNALGSCPAV
jgi:hypothetical protein